MSHSNTNDRSPSWVKRTNLAFQVIVTFGTCCEWVTRIERITSQDRPKEWPHAGPLPSGLARTIARLCRSILLFSPACLRPLTTAWVTSFPAFLRVYGVPAGAQSPMISRAFSIKSQCLQRPPGRDGKNHPGFATNHKRDTGNPLLCRVFHSIQHSSLWDRCSQTTANCDDCSDITHKMTQGSDGTVFSK